MIERKRPPTHPGAILHRHYLEPLRLTVTEVSKDLGVSRKTVSAIINERAPVTVDMALRLSRAFKTSPELWTNLQTNYDLWHVAHENHAWEKVKSLRMELVTA